MFRKIVSLLLAAAMMITVFAACGETDDESGATYGSDETKTLADSGVTYGVASSVSEGTAVSLKVGVILVGDETESYTEAHIEGIQSALTALGLDYTDNNVCIWNYEIEESEECQETAKNLVAQGCNLIISNSYGHQDYMKAVAEEYPDVMFVAMTGDTAASSGLSNFANAFTEVYQSRYVSGVVAGMKLAELIANDEIPETGYDSDGNVKIGYVGAYNYAEVVSGYTAFFLGIQSVVSNVSMEVKYTNSWYDWDAENEAAKVLIADGCVIIGQHADSTGAPTAVQDAYESGTVVYSVGYNVDMTDIGDAVLTSATNVWEVYYEYLFKTMLYGGTVATNWTGGYEQGAVAITTLGTQVAEGTAEKVAEVEAALQAGTTHVFDTSKFTIDGATITWAYATDSDGDFTYDCNNVISDGYYHESWVQSAPSFALRIDGITELS
ncbi:MAG: BMP family ABC transporter substrate-binding protein [Clostridiales bacterium]|nr:BMP family ABC transporter substrate-binding protein [Clostridiales bacterium]